MGRSSSQPSRMLIAAVAAAVSFLGARRALRGLTPALQPVGSVPIPDGPGADLAGCGSLDSGQVLATA